MYRSVRDRGDGEEGTKRSGREEVEQQRVRGHEQKERGPDRPEDREEEVLTSQGEGQEEAHAGHPLASKNSVSSGTRLETGHSV